MAPIESALEQSGHLSPVGHPSFAVGMGEGTDRHLGAVHPPQQRRQGAHPKQLLFGLKEALQLFGLGGGVVLEFQDLRRRSAPQRAQEERGESANSCPW